MAAGKSGTKKGKAAARGVKVVRPGAAARAAVVKPVETPVAKPVEVVKTAPVKIEEEGWFERSWKRIRGEKPEGEMRENLDAVKAGVMHELESLSAEKGVALSGGPFSRVVLPQVKQRKPWLWPMVVGVALVLVVIMVMVGRKPADPAQVWHSVLVAVQSKDVSAFDDRVDVAAVASSVVNQVFSMPEMGQGVPDEMKAKLADGMGARMTAFLKPGLADTLKDEILQAVKEGKFPQGDESLLARIWQDAGGDNLRLGKVMVAMQEHGMAVAEVPLERADLGLTLPLQVVFNHAPDARGSWQVADIPNFAAVMETFAEAARKRAARVEEMAAAQVGDKVSVSGVKKAKAEIDGILVTMTVVNVSDGEVRDLGLRVTFGDAAGQPLKVSDLTLEGALKPHETREQTWTVAIDRDKAVERYVLDLPLSALTVKVVPVGNRSRGA